MNPKTLDKILDEHKKWLQSNGEEGQKADLCRADLREANLHGADLREANLCEANLCRANLCEANLCEANLCRANLCRADLREANLCRADLHGANLRGADLRGADLREADLDYSAFPLWCGGLDIHIDDRQATQLLYHLIRNVKYSRNTSKGMKKLCKIKSLIKQVNKFHRADECGRIEEDEEKDETD